MTAQSASAKETHVFFSLRITRMTRILHSSLFIDYHPGLNEADALIVGSPVYYGQPNGAVMAVLQRAFFSGAKVQNKPAAAVAICRRGGATAAYQTLNMIFEMMNMPVVTSQYWNIAYGLAPGEATQDTEGMQTMRVLADNMAWLLKKIHANGNPDYPEREDWQGMNFIR